MLLSVLIQSCAIVKRIGDEEDVEIAALSTDSRKAQTNGLFFCLKGDRIDSHDLAFEAVKNGAVAVVTERELSIQAVQILVEDTRETLALMSSAFYGEPSKHLKIVGITGTNGKTTTSYMLASILEKAEKKVGVIGTLGAKYAGKTIDFGLTTPDPIDLQRLFADMLLHDIEYVVMEVSAHALYYKKILGTVFSVCIFTNFSQDHLDFFHSMQAYQQAKMNLFTEYSCPLVILNGDDDVGRKIGNVLATKTLPCKTIYYGLHTPSDAFAVITNETLTSSNIVLNINDSLSRVRLSMIGRHNVYNALAAAVCATEFGVTMEAVSEGLNAVLCVDGRLENVGEYHGATVFVDFAHTPDGLSKSLDALRPHCKGRLICVFGCGGNRDQSKRPFMGEIAAKKSDFAILTSDNPRYEDPLDVIADIEKGFRRFSIRYVVVPDRKKALEYAMEYLKSGDVLLVAGKGGEHYQEIMGIKYPFNDNDILNRLLEKKDKNTYS